MSDVASGAVGAPGAPGGAAGLPAGFEATGPPLGAGATAVVWPARRLLDGREFALKVWRRPFSGVQERERFRREVRQQAALNDVSGHVVTYSWAEEDPTEGMPWIGTQRHGESLQQLLERGRPPLPQALVLCADLLAGLAAMHGLGALHRDVKPGNVLVHDGRAKLCDLGLAMDSAGDTADAAAGSARYVAPELLDGTVRPSPRTDVYSAARTIRQTLGPGLAEPLEQLVTEACSLEPDDRPLDASSFERRFRQACAVLGHRLPEPLPARPIAAVSAPAHRQAGQGWRTKRVLVPGAAGLLLVAVGGAVVLHTHGYPGDRLRDRPDAGSAGSAASLAKSAGLSTPAGRLLPARPDARLAPPDIGTGGRPVVLPAAAAGRCPALVRGAVPTGTVPYRVDGAVVAEVQSFYSRLERRACAKFVKPVGSALRGRKTHLALTLCGDGNSCAQDWNAYAVDAGPAVVPSRTGCVSWRVSMLAPTGSRWLVRDAVRSIGCS